MTAAERKTILNAIKLHLDDGTSEAAACDAAGVSVGWWRRWHGRLEEAGLDGLADLPRSGRPSSVRVSADDAAMLRAAYLQSNRGKGAGSMSMAARNLAYRNALAPELCAEILKPRASKHQLPREVIRAMRSAPAEVARYRDPKAGQNDGIYTPGWLRMATDGSRRLLPGERQVWDDASVNVGVVVPWTRGGDACSDKFGVRVARFQLLLGIDCATDFVCGYGYVMRGNDAYNGGDAVRAMHGAWSLTGKAPREVVLEGGAWQSAKMIDFLNAAGVRQISAKGRPNQKLVEGFFSRLWTALSLELPAHGQVGRFRGEMAAENTAWMRCREGRADPRDYFPMLDDFLEALDKAIEFVNADQVESRVYGNWRPVEAQIGWQENAITLPAGLWRHALPVDEVRKCRRNGQVQLRTDSPFGFPHDYVFSATDLYRFDGAEIRIQFDPHLVSSGAVLTLPRAWHEYPAGYVISESAQCISPAPDMQAVTGWMDNREAARAVKRSSRALVATSVAAFDPRKKQPAKSTIARGVSPKVAVLDYATGTAAHVEEGEDALETIRRSRQTAALATDWAKLEEEAGIIA